jgi:WD40 repeat protein
MRDESPEGSGLIAAAYGDSIGVGTPGGESAFGLRAAPPVGFSASGTYLATAGADLWSRTGAHLGLAFGQTVVTWAWSPAGDCLVGIERGRLMFVRPDKPPKVLVRGVPVSDLAFSPDGSRLIFAVAEGSDSTGIWLTDLRSGEVKLLLDEIGWEVTAWSRAMRPIMLQEEAGARSRDGLSFGSSDEVAYCGSEVITVQGGRLATFGVRDVPSFLDADRRFTYTAVGCSPSDDQLIAVRDPKGNASSTSLAVLRLDGSLVREFGEDTATEDFPMWGPSGTGVVFAASPQGGEPLVWFVPEGGQPRQTGLRVERLGDGLDALLDWNVTPPVGHPTS